MKTPACFGQHDRRNSNCDGCAFGMGCMVYTLAGKVMDCFGHYPKGSECLTCDKASDCMQATNLRDPQPGSGTMELYILPVPRVFLSRSALKAQARPCYGQWQVMSRACLICRVHDACKQATEQAEGIRPDHNQEAIRYAFVALDGKPQPLQQDLPDCFGMHYACPAPDACQHRGQCQQQEAAKFNRLVSER